MDKAGAMIRRALLAVAGNEALYLVTAFVVGGVLCMGPMGWYGEAVDLAHSYIVVPWGLALCLLQLERRAARGPGYTRVDIALLLVLLAWIVVPFALRFGLTFNNATSWQGSATVYFGLYAMAGEQSAARRARHLDQACALFALLGLALGVPMLWCAWTVQSLGAQVGGIPFGIVDGMYLCHGVHYNHTGMVSLCCVTMALAGASRARRWPVRALCIAGAAVMAAVAVLTQSRTARYALILALAAAAYSITLRALRQRALPLRQIAALAAACAVAVGGYGAAKALSDAAIAHYAAHAQGQTAALPAIVGAAKAEAAGEAADESAQPDQPAQPAQPAIESRAAVDATLSGRTDVWKNLIDYWRRNPKYLLIGNGTGRTGSLVVQGTIHESAGAVMIHNAYLQFVADYGLIGFALLLAFAASIAPAVLRAFLRPRPGELALCMMAVCALLTGMMESQPLGAMTPINMVFFYALSMLKNGSQRDA